MPQNAELKKLSATLKQDVASAQIDAKNRQQNADLRDALAVQAVLESADIPKRIRSGETNVRVLQLTEANVHSSFFSPGHPLDNNLARLQRQSDELQKVTPADLIDTAANVFQTCLDAGLNPSIAVYSEYETDIPYIIVTP
ncbi:MAG TPA: hypothetical protein V6C81_12000 [Planktothrix sp.]|jgi:hypothetical protein